MSGRNPAGKPAWRHASSPPDRQRRRAARPSDRRPRAPRARAPPAYRSLAGSLAGDPASVLPLTSIVGGGSPACRQTNRRCDQESPDAIGSQPAASSAATSEPSAASSSRVGGVRPSTGGHGTSMDSATTRRDRPSADATTAWNRPLGSPPCHAISHVKAARSAGRGVLVVLLDAAPFAPPERCTPRRARPRLAQTVDTRGSVKYQPAKKAASSKANIMPACSSGRLDWPRESTSPSGVFATRPDWRSAAVSASPAFGPRGYARQSSAGRGRSSAVDDIGMARHTARPTISASPELPIHLRLRQSR
jgi:hypothetical protein